MGYDYDRLYGETPDALGAPNEEIVAFFGRYEGQGARILDVGCGQGRDALFIARAGHRVVGVDLSPNGIAGMTAAAEADGLPIEGIVADLEEFEPEGVFDVVLCDRTLHMLEREARNTVLARLLDHVAGAGWILIADERSNLPDFEAVLRGHAVHWQIEKLAKGYLFARRPAGDA